MEFKKLPGTSIEVSKICLGTMTWGNQNSEEQGHEQMDYAVSRGVNFFDTAELYAVPPSKETQGETERIIGTWFKKTGKRKDIILASKIVGPRDFTKHIRTDLSYSKKTIDEAIYGSLKRMQTDYIDLYQLHWPERPTNFFGERGYTYQEGDVWEENFELVLDAFQEHVKKGTIRYVGLSNETPWGTMRFIQAAGPNRPKMITIQNPYSLLNRLPEIGLAEICHRENVGLLPYSPLAFGTLSGKYRNGNLPSKSRLALFPHYDRYSSSQCLNAIEGYYNLAQDHGLTLTEMALAFVNDRPFVTSNIIGATTIAQLKENIDSASVKLSDEVLEGIDAIQEQYPNPAP